MKVKELIELLQKQPQDTKVFIMWDAPIIGEPHEVFISNDKTQVIINASEFDGI